MDVPDHTSCRALALHSLIDLFTGAPLPNYCTLAPFSSSRGERKLMKHFVVILEFAQAM
jgi:hypothetical protein